MEFAHRTKSEGTGHLFQSIEFVKTSTETILENCVLSIMTYEISCITYSIIESIHGMYLFFSMQPITNQAKMNRFTVLECRSHLSTNQNAQVKRRVNQYQNATSQRYRPPHSPPPKMVLP